MIVAPSATLGDGRARNSAGTGAPSPIPALSICL